MSRYCASALLTITVALATLIALKFDVSATLANVMPPNSYEDEGRQLGARRRHRRAVAEARGMHNRTRELIPLVESELRLAAHRLRSIDGRRPSSGSLLDSRCHAREHTGYAGDGAAVWGLNFKLRDAGECCAACKAHAATCGAPDGRGKSWWSKRPEMKCGRAEQACTIWTFCPEERCFAFDIHKHGYGECWLKFQAGIPPSNIKSPWKLKDPHFGSQTYPEIMRHAPRKKWPWPVADTIWQGPMPMHVPWISGALADAEVDVVSTAPNDKWKERWCKKHGPCLGEHFDLVR